MPFGAKEVEAFFMRHECGLAGAEPNDLVAIADAMRVGRTYDEVAHLLLPAETELLPQSLGYSNTGGTRARRKGRLDLAYLKFPFSANAPFHLSAETLLFPSDSCEPQSITVYNRTNSPATAYWCIPSDSAFCVVPLHQDVPPSSYCTFTLSMTSGGLLPLDDQFLECYVNYKQMRSFRLVEDGGFTPPHFFTLRCQRELASRKADEGTIAPLVKVCSSVTFPTCRAGDTVHAVLNLENCGDVAVMFTVSVRMDTFEPKNGAKEKEDEEESAPSAQLFTCSPTSGLMPPHGRAPVVLSFQPSSAARFRGRAVVLLNNSPKDEITIALRGESFSLELVIEDNSMIVFPPTCVTGAARRQLKIFNPTCIPIAFDVQPSSELAGAVQIDPIYGVLGAGDRTEISLLFTPSEAELYEGHVNFCIYDNEKAQAAAAHGDVSGAEKTRKIVSCPCMGEGRYAVVEVEPVTMEHEGPAMQKQTFEWTIYNSSVCEVCYEVRWLSKTGAKCWQGQEAPPVQLSNNKSGTLAARSHTVVLVTLRPPAGVSEYILYTLVGGSGVSLETIPHPVNLHEVRQYPHCEVLLKGTRPAVQITDVRSLQQHRSQLWCQMAINSVNAVLAAPVEAIDVESDSFAFPQYIKGLEPIFMDVGVGSVLHANKEVLIRVENAGSCPASFRFWYPTEHEGGNETWFIEDEELEDVQRILANRLLEISPQECTIPVGSHKLISITYRHTVVGTHCLPVLLRLNEGKKVLLVLEGRTVLPDTNALAFHHPSLYNLHPVALGDVEPPLQSTTIENTASQAVEYIVQEDLLQSVAEKNCGFPVFQCLNPTGVIPAGGAVQLNWYFRPLEARGYRIDVSMRTVNGEEYTVQFVGFGYHPKMITPEASRAVISDAFLPIPVLPALRLPIERCPVTLSLGVMRVGPAPCFSLHRRVCYLENRHSCHTYSFAWKTKLAPGSSKLQVTPSSGVLGPGTRVRCRLALYCGSLSQVLETPVSCHIHNETIAAAAAAGGGGGGQNPPIMEPVSTEEESAESGEVEEELLDDPLLDAKTPPRSRGFERSTCTKLRQAGSNKKRLPVTVIPPEFQSVRVLADAAASHAAGCQQPPAEEGPVAHHSLELLVQARIMPIETYEQIYGSRNLQQTYFPTLCHNYADPAALHEARKQRKNDVKAHSREEAAVALKVLDGLLRTIIDRPQVRAAFTEHIQEEVPYYREIVAASVDASAGPGAEKPLRSSATKRGTPQRPLPEEPAAKTKPQTPPLLSLAPAARDSVSRPTMRHGGAMLNMVEELLADVALHIVDTVSGDMQSSSSTGITGTKN
ncbi:hypothetical protein DQ04_05171050 [Trypanosoma grayi]|uniref:hypothetical protein n=1 Tax=Trypanosoma grayi TaxID=71804 RepID=UPI0004F4433F|nr:hypothetical protein DQ04_05171050 [Trypanosoma grayi]KEG09469.1 hypothetical protein DQ04_05171050 [Trypanosoma grayi]